jgi:uncharacterized protein (TIGR02588 family)
VSEQQKPINQDSTETSGRTVAEWTTLGVSLAILGVLFAAITWLWLEADSRPATVEVTPFLDAARQDGDVWYLPVEVTNRGDNTAEDVIVEAELDTGEEDPETAEITFTFLAAGETARGTVVLTSDPNSANLTVRPVSFKEP